MILQDISASLSKQKQQVHRERMVRQILEIMIAMVSGLAIGLAAISCFTKKPEWQSHKGLKKKSEETVESVMDAAENVRDNIKSVSDDIKSGYEDFKQDAQEVADEISDYRDQSPE